MNLTTQLDGTRHENQSVQEVSKQNESDKDGKIVALQTSSGVSPARATAAAAQKDEHFGKTHANYWRKRLFHSTYTREGQRHEVKEWSVKIQHLGCRKTFSLGSTNRDLAAAKAKEVYMTIVGKGWAAGEALFNPDMITQKSDPSLGSFLAEVGLKASLKPKTFRNYASSFRTIVSSILKLSNDKAKFDYRTGGQKKWQASVDSVKLALITPDKVQAWKVAFIRAAGDSPIAQASAKRTVNSYIRCARCLFSKGILKFIKVRLPHPLPFEGVELAHSDPVGHLFQFLSDSVPGLSDSCRSEATLGFSHKGVSDRSQGFDWPFHRRVPIRRNDLLAPNRSAAN